MFILSISEIKDNSRVADPMNPAARWSLKRQSHTRAHRHYHFFKQDCGHFLFKHLTVCDFLSLNVFFPPKRIYTFADIYFVY